MKKRLKYIGDNIRQSRINKGLTIEQLAEQADISESFLGLVERGSSGLSIETLIVISQKLDVTTDSLIIEKTVPSETPTNKITLTTLIQNSDDEDIDFLLEFINYIKSAFQQSNFIFSKTGQANSLSFLLQTIRQQS